MSLSLSIGMLWVRMSMGDSPGLILYVVVLTNISLAGASVVAGLAPGVHIMIANAPQQQPAGNFEKTSFITHKLWRIHSKPGATE